MEHEDYETLEAIQQRIEGASRQLGDLTDLALQIQDNELFELFRCEIYLCNRLGEMLAQTNWRIQNDLRRLAGR